MFGWFGLGRVRFAHICAFRFCFSLLPRIKEAELCSKIRECTGAGVAQEEYANEGKGRAGGKGTLPN